ncbi:hypothetical protein NA56DRAFT_703161 [Hyaloscypha hepaticicola]|uniref:Uncharacterized protein n=1 Tax=Hyaloscypha hepaticicola TaxID=2082293 RepID=A0A2J6Q5G7_9HELO|nr:hypothetical protein NA56DRAFT_703161 [Hyaloscypha hepaticicola]
MRSGVTIQYLDHTKSGGNCRDGNNSLNLLLFKQPLAPDEGWNHLHHEPLPQYLPSSSLHFPPHNPASPPHHQQLHPQPTSTTIALPPYNNPSPIATYSINPQPIQKQHLQSVSSHFTPLPRPASEYLITTPCHS